MTFIMTASPTWSHLLDEREEKKLVKINFLKREQLFRVGRTDKKKD